MIVRRGLQRGVLLGLLIALAAASSASATPPNQPTLGNATVQENQPAGTVVGTLSSSDPDGGTTFTYKLVAGTGDTGNAKFKIVGDKLTTRQVLDYETQQNASIRVRVTDAQAENNRSVFSIQITNDTSDDVNHPPTNVHLSNHWVAENQPSGTTVGALASDDPDLGDSFTYSLVPGSGSQGNASFTIAGSTLKTNAVFDYEAKKSYSVRIQTDDGHGHTFAKAFAVTVTDLVDTNHAPTDITFSNLSVPENSASGTEVGTASTTDADASDTFIYKLVTGTGDTDNASFQMAGDKLKTTAVLDFEAKSQYSVRVQSDDGRGGAFQKAFVVQVTDIGENLAPTDISLSAASIAENQPSATTVGTLSATDADAADIQTLTLVSGTGDDDNAAFTIAGSTLKTSAVFDYETKTSYSIRVQTDDGNGHTFQKQFTITITDVNETAVAVDDSRTVDKLSDATTINVLANDTNPDGGAISIASVTQPANGAVAITNSGADLTYTPNPRYCNNPTVDDPTPPSGPDTFTYTLASGSTATVSMTVNPIREVPRLLAPITLEQREPGQPAHTFRLVTSYEDADANKITALFKNRFDASGFTDPASCDPGIATLFFHWVIKYPGIDPYTDAGIHGYRSPVLTMDPNSLIDGPNPPVIFRLSVISTLAYGVQTGVSFGIDILSRVTTSQLTREEYTRCQVTPETCTKPAALPATEPT